MTCTASGCPVTVPAPGFALVFLNDDVFSVNTAGDAVSTFPTSAQTKTRNTVIIDPSVLATSNGHTGGGRQHLGSTSKGSSGALGMIDLVPGIALLGAVIGGALFVGMR